MTESGGTNGSHDSFWSIPWGTFQQQETDLEHNFGFTSDSIHYSDHENNDPHDAAALTGASEAAALSLASLLYDEDMVNESPPPTTQACSGFQPPPQQLQMAMTTQMTANGNIESTMHTPTQSWNTANSVNIGQGQYMPQNIYRDNSAPIPNPDIESLLSANMATMSAQRVYQLASAIYQIISFESGGYGSMSLGILYTLLTTKYPTWGIRRQDELLDALSKFRNLFTVQPTEQDILIHCIPQGVATPVPQQLRSHTPPSYANVTATCNVNGGGVQMGSPPASLTLHSLTPESTIDQSSVSKVANPGTFTSAQNTEAKMQEEEPNDFILESLITTTAREILTERAVTDHRDILLSAEGLSTDNLVNFEMKAVELANALRSKVGTVVLAKIREKFGGLLSLLEKHHDSFCVKRVPKQDSVRLSEETLNTLRLTHNGNGDESTLVVSWLDASREGDSTDVPSRCLHVGNVPAEMKEKDLQKVFAKFGPIENVSVVAQKRDNSADAGGRHRQFGFVNFINAVDAKIAKRELSKQPLWRSNISFARNETVRGTRRKRRPMKKFDK